MIRRILAAAVLIPLVLAALFFFPAPLFLIFLNVFMALSLYELLKLLERYGAALYGPTFPLVLLLPWVWLYRPELVLPFLVLATFFLLGWSVLRSRALKDGLVSSSGNLLALLYVGFPFSVAAILSEGRERELLLLLLVIWAGDGLALLAGQSLGRHRITPRLSPQKTLEGYLAGIFGAALAALLCGLYLFPGWSPAYLVLAGLVLGGAGILGDLFESLLKRGVGVKDASHLIPGHGGLLDRIDSLLFALPAYYSLSTLVESSAIA